MTKLNIILPHILYKCENTYSAKMLEIQRNLCKHIVEMSKLKFKINAIKLLRIMKFQ